MREEYKHGVGGRKNEEGWFIAGRKNEEEKELMTMCIWCLCDKYDEDMHFCGVQECLSTQHSGHHRHFLDSTRCIWALVICTSRSFVPGLYTLYKGSCLLLFFVSKHHKHESLASSTTPFSTSYTLCSSFFSQTATNTYVNNQVYVSSWT